MKTYNKSKLIEILNFYEEHSKKYLINDDGLMPYITKEHSTILNLIQTTKDNIHLNTIEYILRRIYFIQGILFCLSHFSIEELDNHLI